MFQPPLQTVPPARRSIQASDAPGENREIPRSPPSNTFQLPQTPRFDNKDFPTNTGRPDSNFFPIPALLHRSPAGDPLLKTEQPFHKAYDPDCRRPAQSTQ